MPKQTGLNYIPDSSSQGLNKTKTAIPLIYKIKQAIIQSKLEPW